MLKPFKDLQGAKLCDVSHRKRSESKDFNELRIRLGPEAETEQEGNTRAVFL
jgi:hypothetical protein